MDGESSFSNVKNQLYATLIANTVIFAHGTIVGWFSPALPVLLSESTPLITGPMSNEEISWISSMSSIGAIVGTFIFGFLSSQIGPKRAMKFLSFPPIIYWILVRYGNTFYYLLTARFITGLTVGGMQSIIALFVSEIANDNVRGRLGSISPLARNVGVLLGYIVGAVVEYEYRPFIFIVFPVIYLALVYTLPNTPQYHLQKESFEKAEKALKYYKGCDGKTDQDKAQFTAEFERLKLVVKERNKSKTLQFTDFYNWMAFKAIITSIAMAWFIQSPGSYLFINYAMLIFKKSGTVLDPHLSSIILAIVQIVAGLVSTQLGDTFGRKTTLYISLSGCAVGLSTFTVYSYLRETGYDVSNYIWLPEVCMSLIIFIACSGIVALAHICAIENFSPKIRTIGVVFYSLCISLFAFLGDKYFPILLEAIHLHGCLLFFATNCCIGLFFVASMKETRGQSLDSIQSTGNQLSAHKDSN